jgi:hypothetical protein
MVMRGGIMVTYPDWWLNGTIGRLIKAVGLEWNDSLNPFIEKDKIIVPEQFYREFAEKNIQIAENYSTLVQLSNENLLKLEEKNNV